MMREQKIITDRNIDLVEKDAIQNPYRREAILREHRVIYARSIH